jgi:hypothetical protein
LLTCCVHTTTMVEHEPSRVAAATTSIETHGAPQSCGVANQARTPPCQQLGRLSYIALLTRHLPMNSAEQSLCCTNTTRPKSARNSARVRVDAEFEERANDARALIKRAWRYALAESSNRLQNEAVSNWSYLGAEPFRVEVIAPVQVPLPVANLPVSMR